MEIKRRLVLKAPNGLSKLAEWLNYYNLVNGSKGNPNSLLLEFDVEGKRLLSKFNTDTKDYVRYSEISFEDVGVELLEVSSAGETQYNNERILAGFLYTLDKLISISKILNSTEVKLSIYFIESMYHTGMMECVKVKFETSSFMMNLATSKVAQHFNYLTDEFCKDKLFVIPNPIEFEVTPTFLSEFYKVAKIYSDKQEKTKMSVSLYSKNGTVYISDFDGNVVGKRSNGFLYSIKMSELTEDYYNTNSDFDLYINFSRINALSELFPNGCKMELSPTNNKFVMFTDETSKVLIGCLDTNKQ